MALIQTRKESIHFHHDKENSSNHANITTKKSNFLIKKCAKATIKPILKSLIQPTLDYLDTQIFNNGKLHVVNPHVQDPALTRKINANKVKKSLNFDKETYYLKKGHGDWLSHKDKAGIPPKGRFSNIDGVPVKQEEGRGSYPNIESLLNGKDASEMAHEEYEHGLGKVLEQVHIAKEHVEERAVDFKKQANKMVRLYAGDIIQTLKEKDENSRIINCLSRHKITPALRTKMVDWMIEVMCSYKCMDSTFFLAISIMDDFFLKSEVVQSGNDLHLIGVTSMFIASKYEEIYPMRLAVVYDKVAHKKLTPEEITKKEGEMLQALGFNLTFATIYEFITNVIFQLNLEETMTPELYAYLHKVCLYLAKADLHDYDLMNQYNNCQLAAGTLFVAFKVIEQLDSNFPLINLITQVCEILRVDEEVLYHCASKILCLAKNFEKVYANYKNLKKFHFLGAPGEMSGPCGAHNIGNKFSTTH